MYNTKLTIIQLNFHIIQKDSQHPRLRRVCPEVNGLIQQ